jgi:hypothetical protein
MRLPKQLPAVERKNDRCASVAVGAGVKPSFDWGGLLQTALPIATSLLGSL